MENQSKAEILIEKINKLTKHNYDTEIDNEYLYQFLREPNVGTVRIN